MDGESDECRLVTTIATEMVKESGFVPISLEPGLIAMLAHPQLVLLVPATRIDSAEIKADLACWKARMVAREVPRIKKAHLLYCLAGNDREGKGVGWMRDVTFLGKGASCDVIDTSGKSRVSATLDKITRSSIARGIQRYNKGTAASGWELEQEARRQRIAHQMLKDRLASTRPWGSYLIFAICLALYAWASALGGSDSVFTQLHLGANYAPLTIGQDQWWRLVGSTFLHFGPLHLGLNMLALLSFGPHLERIYGNSAFLALYALSGVSGALCSAWNGDIVSVGASGALFGLFGAVVVLSRRYRSEWPAAVRRRLGVGMLPMIGYNLLYGFANEGIDNAAHLGGLAAGVLFALLIRPQVLSTAPPRPLLRLALTILGLAPFLVEILAVQHGLQVKSLADYPTRSYRNPWSSVSVRLPALFEPSRNNGQDFFLGPLTVFAIEEMEDQDVVMVSNPWFQHELKQAEGHRSLSVIKVDGRSWLVHETDLGDQLLFDGYGYVGESMLRLQVLVSEEYPAMGQRLLRQAIESLTIKGFDRRVAAGKLYKQGLHARALEELDGVKEDERVTFLRAVSYTRLSQYEKSKSLLDKLRAAHPDNSGYLAEEAFRLMRARQPEAALEILDRMLAAASSDREKAYLGLNRAIALMMLRRDVEAESIFSSLIDTDKRGAGDLYNAWAWELAMQGNYKEALPLSERSVLLHREANNLDTLGTILFGLERYEHAAKVFDDTLSLDPNLGNSNFYKARLLERAGEKRLASLYFHCYLLLDGANSQHAEEARRALRDLGEGPGAGR